VKEIKQGAASIPSRTAFLGDFKFPVSGMRQRHAALAEIRHSASWDESEIEAAIGLRERVKSINPRAAPGDWDSAEKVADSARHVYYMLQQACTRGAKYQVAAEALLARVDQLERKLRLARAGRLRR
jgi:hypothetical protein